jgi:hypothetical protein
MEKLLGDSIVESSGRTRESVVSTMVDSTKLLLKGHQVINGFPRIMGTKYKYDLRDDIDIKVL